MSEIYPNGKLDYDLIQDEGLYELYDKASSQVKSCIGVNEKREWSSYGCGFASFLESWFYREGVEFKAEKSANCDESYRGIFIIFSLLEPMFAAGESNKQWGANGGAALLPSLDMIDMYESRSTLNLSRGICRVLRNFGVPQVSCRTLSEPLPTGISIESNMATEPLTLFDAFYHWED